MTDRPVKSSQADLQSTLTSSRQELFPGLCFRHSPASDTITWSNKHVPKPRTLFGAYIISLIMVTGLGIFLTYSLVNDLYGKGEYLVLSTTEWLISSLFIVVSWGAVIAISYYLLRLTWTETIEISNEAIRLGYSGLMAPKDKCFVEYRIWCLSFEKVGNERDSETRFTLNIFDIDDKRQTLAYWIRAEETYQLFLLMEKIFANRGWSIQSRSTYKMK